jgi:hypothetical protein
MFCCNFILTHKTPKTSWIMMCVGFNDVKITARHDSVKARCSEARLFHYESTKSIFF